MARCPGCHRRLPAGGRCPRDGGTAPAAEAAGEPAPVAELSGYRVIAPLGQGGFGSVWEVADAAGAWAALKVSHLHDADARARMEREAAALARVGPPHVPALL